MCRKAGVDEIPDTSGNIFVPLSTTLYRSYLYRIFFFCAKPSRKSGARGVAQWENLFFSLLWSCSSRIRLCPLKLLLSPKPERTRWGQRAYCNCRSSVVRSGVLTEYACSRADPLLAPFPWVLLFFIMISLYTREAGATALPSCSTFSTTLATSDTTVNVSCTSIAFANVVVQGSMILNISITDMMASNPSSGRITVTISSKTLRQGATLAIDSRGYTAPAGGGGPTVSIMIQSLIGNDGCLVFLGSFPMGTSILVTDVKMVSSTSAAPTLSDFDPYEPAHFKMVMLVNVSLTGNSSMIFANSSLVASNPTALSTFIIFPFLVTGGAPMTVSNSSTLAFRNCSVSAANGSPFLIDSNVVFDGRSVFSVTLCSLLSSTGGYDAMLFSGSSAITNESSVTFQNSTVTTFAGGYAVHMASAAFSNGSSMVIRACTLTSFGGVAFYMENRAAFSDHSYLAIALSSLMSTGLGSIYLRYGTFSDGSFILLSLSNVTAGALSLGGWAFQMSPATFVNNSFISLIDSTLTASSAGGYYGLHMLATTFRSNSGIIVSACTVTASAYFGFYMLTAIFANCSYMVVTESNVTGYNFAFSVSTTTTVEGGSYVIVTRNKFYSTSTTIAYPPIAFGGSGSLSIASSSLVLFKGNEIQSLGGYGACVETTINFSSATNAAAAGTLSIIDNSCTCGPGCSMWIASSVVNGAGGKIYQRCNTVNGIPAGSPQLPAGAVSVGVCGSCNASADCFGPLTADNSTCSVNGTTSTAVCQCLFGGVGSNMCLPPSSVFPSSSGAAGGRTATPSPSSEMPSGAMSATRSGSVESASASYSRSLSVASVPASSSDTVSGTENSQSASMSLSAQQPSLSTSSSSSFSFSLRTTSPQLFPKSFLSLSMEDARDNNASLSGIVIMSSTSSSSTSASAARATTRKVSSSDVSRSRLVSHSLLSFSVASFSCELSYVVLAQGASRLTFSMVASSVPSGGSNNSTPSVPGGEGVVSVPAGGILPMALVLAAAGSILRVDFVAMPGYSFADPANMSTSLGNVVRAVSHTANISVDVSIATVQTIKLSASSVTRFTVSVEVLVSPPFGTPCPPAIVTLAFECFFSPLRTSPELKSAVDTTYRTSTAVSSVLGNPVTAMSNTGMVSILTLEECVFSDIDPLDASVSPIPFAFGDELGQYYRGGVVVAIGISAGYFALALLFSVVFPKFIPSRTPRDVLGLLRYPSSVMIFVGMFHQGMICSSVSLLRLANSPLDMLLGSCGLVAATCLTVFFCLAGTWWRRCHIANRSEDGTRLRVSFFQLFLDLGLWKQHWVDDIGVDGTLSGYKRRYLFILDDMAAGYWAGVELISGLAQGAILGVRKNDVDACQIQRLVLAVHCFLMLAASLIILPCGSILGNVFLILSKLGSFVVALLIVIHTVSGSEAAQRDAELAVAGFAFISSVQTAIQLLIVVLHLRRSLLLHCRRRSLLTNLVDMGPPPGVPTALLEYNFTTLLAISDKDQIILMTELEEAIIDDGDADESSVAMRFEFDTVDQMDDKAGERVLVAKEGVRKQSRRRGSSSGANVCVDFDDDLRRMYQQMPRGTSPL